MSEPTLYELGRAWVADCVWTDLTEEEDHAQLTAEQVRRGIERHYVGGWDQFVEDARS